MTGAGFYKKFQPALKAIAESGEYLRQLETDNTRQSQEIRRLREDIQQLKELLRTEQIAREAAEHNLEQSKAQTSHQIVLNAPNIKELYPGECINYVLCSIKVMQKGSGKGANSARIRSIDILQGILDSNPQEVQDYETFKGKIKDLRQLANQQALGTPKGKKTLRELNLETYKAENNHTGIRFKGDDRYRAIESSTSSENARGGKNEVSYLLHAMFPSENKV